MEQIIGKLSEIETTAETIMKDALQKKKAFSLDGKAVQGIRHPAGETDRRAD